MKIRASLKPLRRDNVRTMGSVRNILKGRPQVIRISLAENRSLKGTSSSGPQIFLSWPLLRRFFAILSGLGNQNEMQNLHETSKDKLDPDRPLQRISNVSFSWKRARSRSGCQNSWRHTRLQCTTTSRRFNVRQLFRFIECPLI